MALSENQLETWSNQGSVTGSANTYNSIKVALESYTWPSTMNHIVYLQGSYGNSTNIRGNSDVDVVVETEWVFYNNLSEDEKRVLQLTPGKYTWNEFRAEVVKALISYYGASQVDTSKNKSIKLLANSNRLAADIVPCAKYRKYSNYSVIAEGITFWTMNNGTQIINYPKIHKENGIIKNDEKHTNGWFKPTVRIFKNMKEKIISDDPSLAGKYPSYFVENLLYNVPNYCFGTSYQSTVIAILKYLVESYKNESINNFVCQNAQENLFGSNSTQWNKSDCLSLIEKSINLMS